ncbi:oxaA/YidC-like membrane insertion protein [Striga asiatica]|uniref:OxaA/YidC-like membrane insertion protein n=1 Tax=Striga asiatica TaxID=4170 RepID=A0A5A7QQP7_STRAF|nr:oxaA/YidC-like membrane insertion protein [Striga asiatica]
MSTFLYSIGPNVVVSPSPGRTRIRTVNPVFQRANFSNFSTHKPLFRGSLGLARFGLGQFPSPDPENAELFFTDLIGRVEGFLYTIADATVSYSDTVDAVSTNKQSSDWLSGITNVMEVVLKVLKDGLSTLHVPYAYGFAIILLTVLVKAATFPLSKKQVESAMAMQSLAPQIKAIQERYAGNQEKIQLETARLYKLAGINPLAGCLPTLATIPIWIGLYRALSNVADEGLLTEGFFWIPSLSGPTTIAARQTGSGTSWLFPFISNDPNVKSSQAITNLLPLMIGYFALSVPSGLSLYWFTNNILSTVQQVWFRKLGGAKNPLIQFSDKSVKNEQPEAMKSISEAPAATKVVEKEEKLTKVGLRPGERFKQLKEQEAQRKRQREEERITNGEVNKDDSQLEREDSHHATSTGPYFGNNDELSSSVDGFAVNGNSVNSSVKDGNPEISVDYNNERNKLQLDKNLEKGFLLFLRRFNPCQCNDHDHHCIAAEEESFSSHIGSKLDV